MKFYGCEYGEGVEYSKGEYFQIANTFSKVFSLNSVSFHSS